MTLQLKAKKERTRKNQKSAIQIFQRARKCDQLHTRVASALLYSHRQQAAHGDHTSSHFSSCSSCWNVVQNQHHEIVTEVLFQHGPITHFRKDIYCLLVQGCRALAAVSLFFFNWFVDWPVHSQDGWQHHHRLLMWFDPSSPCDGWRWERN